MIGDLCLAKAAAVSLCALRLRLRAAPGACRSARRALRFMRGYRSLATSAAYGKQKAPRRMAARAARL